METHSRFPHTMANHTHKCDWSKIGPKADLQRKRQWTQSRKNSRHVPLKNPSIHFSVLCFVCDVWNFYIPRHVIIYRPTIWKLYLRAWRNTKKGHTLRKGNNSIYLVKKTKWEMKMRNEKEAVIKRNRNFMEKWICDKQFSIWTRIFVLLRNFHVWDVAFHILREHKDMKFIRNPHTSLFLYYAYTIEYQMTQIIQFPSNVSPYFFTPLLPFAIALILLSSYEIPNHQNENQIQIIFMNNHKHSFGIESICEIIQSI
jgi:hypothetical protein